MNSQVLHTVWCNISAEPAGEIWHWSLLGVKGLTFLSIVVHYHYHRRRHRHNQNHLQNHQHHHHSRAQTAAVGIMLHNHWLLYFFFFIRWKINSESNLFHNIRWNISAECLRTPRIYDFLRSNRISVLLHQMTNSSFRTLSFRSSNVKTWPRTKVLVLATYGWFISLHLSRHKLCTRRTELALEVNSVLTFTELRGHSDERWLTEVTSNTYFRGVALARSLSAWLNMRRLLRMFDSKRFLHTLCTPRPFWTEASLLVKKWPSLDNSDSSTVYCGSGFSKLERAYPG